MFTLDVLSYLMTNAKFKHIKHNFSHCFLLYYNTRVESVFFLFVCLFTKTNLQSTIFAKIFYKDIPYYHVKILKF